MAVLQVQVGRLALWSADQCFDEMAHEVAVGNEANAAFVVGALEQFVSYLARSLQRFLFAFSSAAPPARFIERLGG